MQFHSQDRATQGKGPASFTDGPFFHNTLNTFQVRAIRGLMEKDSCDLHKKEK